MIGNDTLKDALDNTVSVLDNDKLKYACYQI